MTPEKIRKLGIKRRPGLLYFVDKKGDVSRIRMSGGRALKTEEKVRMLHLKREPGYLYFLDAAGDISRSKEFPPIQCNASPGVPPSCDLKRTFCGLALKTFVDGEKCFTFTGAAFPKVKDRLRTGRLLIQKGIHSYPYDFRMDSLHFHADKETYRNLALLILAVVFCPIPRVHLEMHSKSDIKNLIIESRWRKFTESSPSYQERPDRFAYWPTIAAKHPWNNGRILPVHLPHFGLSNMQGSAVNEKQWQARDTVYGFGSDQAAVLFAELLLNISRPQSNVDEIELEGEPGFRGVAPASAEARLWLPGSIGWEG